MKSRGCGEFVVDVSWVVSTSRKIGLKQHSTFS